MSIGPDNTQSSVEHYINRVAEELSRQCARIISTQLDTIANTVWVPVHLVCLLFFLRYTPLLEPYRDHYQHMIASIAAMVSPDMPDMKEVSS